MRIIHKPCGYSEKPVPVGDITEQMKHSKSMYKLKCLSAIITLCMIMPLSASTGLIIIPKPFEYTSELSSGIIRYNTVDSVSIFAGSKIIGDEGVCTGGSLSIGGGKNKYPRIMISHILVRGGELYNLSKRVPRDSKGKSGNLENQKIVFILESGERLYTERGWICNTIKDEFREIVGLLWINANVFDFQSNQKVMSFMSNDEKSAYVIHKLSCENICKIQIGNTTIEFYEAYKRRIRDTLKAMFNDLALFTGEPFSWTENTSTSKPYKSLEDDLEIQPKEKPTADVKSIYTEHNYRVNGRKGMYVTVSFDVNNMKGRMGKAVAYFYYENGQQLRDFNNSYYTTDGYVSASTEFTPSYDSSTYNGVQIFIPYTELHLSSGISHLKTWVAIFDDNNNQIGESNWSTFRWSSTGSF